MDDLENVIELETTIALEEAEALAKQLNQYLPIKRYFKASFSSSEISPYVCLLADTKVWQEVAIVIGASLFCQGFTTYFQQLSRRLADESFNKFSRIISLFYQEENQSITELKNMIIAIKQVTDILFVESYLTKCRYKIQLKIEDVDEAMVAWKLAKFTDSQKIIEEAVNELVALENGCVDRDLTVIISSLDGSLSLKWRDTQKWEWHEGYMIDEVQIDLNE
jgi:hypothetical protein